GSVGSAAAALARRAGFVRRLSPSGPPGNGRLLARMSLVVVHRPARMPPPGVPSGEVVLAAPPATSRDGPGGMGWMQYGLPVAGSLASLLFMLTNPRPLYIVGGLIFALSSVSTGVAMAVVQSRGQRQRVAAERLRYLNYLAEVRQQARGVARQQHAAAAWSHPPS